MSQPEISIIVPTYNRCDSTINAIESILSQTYQNFEIIIVDDGSADNTGAELQQQFGNQIRYIFQPNRGPSAARNTGLRAAQHDWVAFLDSDDIWLPDKLAHQVPLIQKKGVVLCYCNAGSLSRASQESLFSMIGLDVNQDQAIIGNPLELIIQGSMGILTPACICSKAAVSKAGGFDERLRVGEDTLLWTRLAFEGSFAITSKVLVLRGDTNQADQLTRRGQDDYERQILLSRLLIFQEAYIRSISQPPHIQKGLRRLLANLLVAQTQRMAKDGEFALARHKALEAMAYLPGGKSLIKVVMGMVSPALLAFFCKSKNERRQR